MNGWCAMENHETEPRRLMTSDILGSVLSYRNGNQKLYEDPRRNI